MNLFQSGLEKAQISEPDIKISAAVLMIEVAKSDHEFDQNEHAKIMGLIKTAFGLSEESQEAFLSEASDAANDSTSLYEHTSLINKYYDVDEKMYLVRCMWEVAYADGRIHHYEEHIIRKVAELIYLPHVLFIKAKHEALSISKST